MSAKAPGVYVKHQRICPSREGKRCNCVVRYEARVWDKRGKRAMTKAFGQLAEAKAWRADTISALNRGSTTSSDVTVESIWETAVARWEEGKLPSTNCRALRPSTLRRYKGSWNAYIKDDLGPMRVRDISSADVERLLARCDDADRAPATKSNALIVLRRVIRIAMDWGEITVDPTAGKSVSRKASKKRKVDSIDVSLRLVESLDGWLRAYVATVALTGMRRGEALGLRWGDVDLEKGIVAVERSWDCEERVLNDPKTEAGNRRIPLIEPLLTILRDYRDEVQPKDANVFVFESSANPGNPFGYDSLMHRFRKACQKVGAEGLTLHGLRHTFLTMHARVTKNIRATSDIAGHANASFTLDRYVHSDADSLRSGMDDVETALEALRSGASGVGVNVAGRDGAAR